MKDSQTLSFNQAGREAISQSLIDFFKLGESLYAPFSVNELHEFRIAAKQLRYSVELFTACWGEKIEPFAEQIAEMQDALGEVHDCDVWIDALGARLLDKDCKEFQAAIWLLSRFAKKRTSNYHSALKLWSRWKETGFAEAMRSTIASAG
jgi:CHAD domain-containing protein